jgi:hypothetical protein
VLPKRLLWRGLRDAARGGHPVVYFHPYEFDPHPLYARLPDRLYEDDHALQRWLRPGLFRRRALALDVAARTTGRASSTSVVAPAE